MGEQRNKGNVVLIYDGDCPVCRRYSQAVQVSRQFGGLTTLSARDPDPLVDYVLAQGYDLDEGMVVMLDDNIYHGADALNIMAMIGSKSGFFNRLNYILFSSKFMARFCYPAMRAGRNLLLKLLGVRKLAESRGDNLSEN
ncbi:DCC1-like thiol-disulfide oxidoreductase family protein [Corallincola platygyrae]|uniref:DCC1-like thiol-disulfide oxidoreductase family protein n=1 Tax=Corallincola platygyrae TaxID=1193278 RepID=A0ABW4XHA9_9GAMM